MGIKSSQHDEANVIPAEAGIYFLDPRFHGDDNERTCPQCELMSLKGMPGGKDSICQNCGYKDPCCYD